MFFILWQVGPEQVDFSAQIKINQFRFHEAILSNDSPVKQESP